MAAVVYRGSTCRIKFRPLGDILVSELGEPTIAIYQENNFLTPDNIVVDTENNCIYADLTEEDTIVLSDGLETLCQAAYVDANDNVIRFPTHTLDVRRTLLWRLTEEETAPTQTEETTPTQTEEVQTP